MASRPFFDDPPPPPALPVARPAPGVPGDVGGSQAAPVRWARVLVLGSGGGPGSGSGTSGEIARWVEQHFSATTVDGVTVYDLTQPAT